MLALEPSLMHQHTRARLESIQVGLLPNTTRWIVANTGSEVVDQHSETLSTERAITHARRAHVLDRS
jgi:hypothetical protein